MSDIQRVYELSYLLMPTLSDDLAAERVAEIKKFIADRGGEEIVSGDPERIDLAYTMIKVIDNKNIRVAEAFFGWTKFTLDPELLVELRAMLEAHNDLIRYLLFKTVKENTYIVRKNPRRRTRSEDGAVEGEAVDPMIDAVEAAVPSELAAEEVAIIDEPTESEVLDSKIESLIPDTEQV